MVNPRKSSNKLELNSGIQTNRGSGTKRNLDEPVHCVCCGILIVQIKDALMFNPCECITCRPCCYNFLFETSCSFNDSSHFNCIVKEHGQIVSYQDTCNPSCMLPTRRVCRSFNNSTGYNDAVPVKPHYIGQT